MTTTYAPPLHVVQSPPTGTDRSLFAALLAARRFARRVLDRARAATKAAVRYVLRTAGHWLTKVRRSPLAAALRWLAGKAVSIVPVIKAVGVLPPTLAMLTAPPLQRLAARACRFAGHVLRRAGAALHRATDGLLRRCGALGARLADGLAALKDAILDRLRRLTSSSAYVTVADSVRYALGLVGPLSRSVLLHRVLRLLLQPLWLRGVVEILALPLFLDGRLSEGLLAAVKNLPTWLAGYRYPHPVVAVVMDDTRPVDDPTVPPPEYSSGRPDEFGDLFATAPPQNRAERREQQRQQAQAKDRHVPR